jgi:hypothetical protein
MFSIGITASAELLRASWVISSYESAINHQGTLITVSYDVTATNICDDIGVSQVIIQKRVNGIWETVATYPEYYSHNCTAMSGQKTYYGTAGSQYRSVITFYARQGSVSDSKNSTTASITI